MYWNIVSCKIQKMLRLKKIRSAIVDNIFNICNIFFNNSCLFRIYKNTGLVVLNQSLSTSSHLRLVTKKTQTDFVDASHFYTPKKSTLFVEKFSQDSLALIFCGYLKWNLYSYFTSFKLFTFIMKLYPLYEI